MGLPMLSGTVNMESYYIIIIIIIIYIYGLIMGCQILLTLNLNLSVQFFTIYLFVQHFFAQALCYKVLCYYAYINVKKWIQYCYLNIELDVISDYILVNFLSCRYCSYCRNSSKYLIIQCLHIFKLLYFNFFSLFIEIRCCYVKQLSRLVQIQLYFLVLFTILGLFVSIALMCVLAYDNRKFSIVKNSGKKLKWISKKMDTILLFKY
eukprot:TRINITY_DN10375_c0_g1_i1.p1 TRINITY_DN10375_c0_g1~~TRINITY_DN10375_c0_g1_i1.p1  ORF type:complete len:207 (-),score=-18.66 TRINITY_DN10375_c0_g1_i1:439-1059(-)